MRDLDVVAEDLVEADLQARDAGPLAFVGLVLGDPLLAAGIELAQLVEVGAIAVADEAAVARGERAFVDERRFERAANVGAQVEAGFVARRASALRAAGELRFDLRQQAACGR